MNRPIPTHRMGGASELGRTIVALSEAVGDNIQRRERVDTLGKRLRHKQFQLAVLGQFKRGKSTFINALLGAPLLPIAVVPLTAVPVFISWGPGALVRVRFSDDRPDDEYSGSDPEAIRQFLFRFVSEEANPENRAGVDRVDLFYPAPILADGIVLIDTPGVGSTFRHNTQTALRVLPECDAALFVMSVDPPITEVEIEYLQTIKAKTTKLIFVLNKIDYLPTEERDRVAKFVEQTLKQSHLWSVDTTLFSISSAQGLEAKERADEAGLLSSGIRAVERYLATDLAAQKSRLLEQAVRNRAADIASEAVSDVRLRMRALEMPIEELASKCRSFQRVLDSIRDQRLSVRDLLDGQRKRLRDELEERIKQTRNDASSKLASIVYSQTREAWDAHALSEPITEIFEAARKACSTHFAALVDSILNNHQQRIGALIDEVRRTAGELFETPFDSGFDPEAFSLGEDPYWVTDNIQATLLPDASGLIDRIVPAQVGDRRKRARLLRQVDELILRNAENLRWAILRGIDETFRRENLRFELRLDDAIATTDGVARDALERRRTSRVAIGDELVQLQSRLDLLSELQQRFTKQPRDAEGYKDDRSGISNQRAQ